MLWGQADANSSDSCQRLESGLWRQQPIGHASSFQEVDRSQQLPGSSSRGRDDLRAEWLAQLEIYRISSLIVWFNTACLHDVF